VGMWHKNPIFLVDNRVLNSKFFGKANKMAGCYTSAENYEEGVHHIEEKREQGYAIFVYPEGTRSAASVSQRVHAGGCYLWEKVNLDIQPILIRGNADRLPKNDNQLTSGKLTLEFLPVIRHDDDSWGKNYGEKTKKISRYFKEKFIELKRADEDENYFRNKLKFNYIYKPKFIQKEFNSDFETNKKVYHKILNLIPINAQILHLGCGYGVLDFLLVYDSAKRNVSAWDKDSEKIKIAQNTFTVKRFPVHFIEELPENWTDFEYVIVQN